MNIQSQIPNIVLGRVPRGSLLTLIGKKDLIGVEIGVQWGVNSRWILDNLDIRKLYLIDPYVQYISVSGILSTDEPQTKEIANIYLSKYNDIIEWIYETSINASLSIPDNLDFVYIDGDHRVEMIRLDIKNYIQKIKIGGLLAGHDYNQLQVKKTVNKIFKDKLKTGQHNDWWVIKKDYHNENYWINNCVG